MVLINREEVVRRTLFRASRGDSTRLPNETFNEPTLSRAFQRESESGRELSVRRSHENSEPESSSSDSGINGREIAATAPSTTFSGTGVKCRQNTSIGRISAVKCGKGFQGLAHFFLGVIFGWRRGIFAANPQNAKILSIVRCRHFRSGSLRFGGASAAMVSVRRP